MKLSSIRRYLRPYKIYGNSSTTVSYAFASAIAEWEPFDANKIAEALSILKQDPENLSCVYCGNPAQGWDHLISVVKDGKQFGPGHRIRNLVPCCTRCNGERGNQDFETWLPNRFPGWEERIERLRAYISGQDDAPLPTEIAASRETALAEYWAIRDRVFDLMRQADEIADRINPLRAGASGTSPPTLTTRPRENLVAKHGNGYNPKPGTIGELCVTLLAQRRPTEVILGEVRRRFPGAKTTKACVAWYKSKMKLNSPTCGSP